MVLCSLGAVLELNVHEGTPTPEASDRKEEALEEAIREEAELAVTGELSQKSLSSS